MVDMKYAVEQEVILLYARSSFLLPYYIRHVRSYFPLKQNIKEKMESEIKFHRSFRHKHIVEFIDSFESKFVI